MSDPFVIDPKTLEGLPVPITNGRTFTSAPSVNYSDYLNVQDELSVESTTLKTDIHNLITPSGTPDIPQSVKDIGQNAIELAPIAQGIGSVLEPLQKVGNFFSDTISQQVIVVLGLIFVLGGIFLFRPTRETIISVAKKGAKTAAIAA